MIFIIEGNIGSGKSTLCSQLTDITFNLPHKILYEQVDEWEKNRMEDKSILHHFYSQPSRYAFTFQTYVLLQRVNHLVSTLEQNPNTILICERSHLTDLNIFAKHCYLTGKMNEIEWNTYLEAQTLISKLCPKITGIIYNKADVSVCSDRIVKRNRQGESLIQSSYLADLQQRHDSWLCDEEVSVPILTIDANVDQNSVQRQDQLHVIKDWINSFH